ncbi:MAG: S-layer homology domain-containing protein [Clostridiales bacterium]|nr:S-layer homology domain-containing protein [Clostridiales bacterium]
MKKIIGVIVSLSLIFALIPITYAANLEPAIISVTAPQIDNQVYKYGERVRVVCENTEFTKTGVVVDIMYSTVETIYNVEIIDDYTIEFDLKMFHAAVFNYGLKLEIPQEIGARKTIMFAPVIEVREGHMGFKTNPITTDEITDRGLTVEFVDPIDGMYGEFTFDGETVEYSQLNNEIFRVYPDRELYAGKTEVEVRFNYQGNYYRNTLYIMDNEIWMEPATIARTSPTSFTLNTINLDFDEDISIIIKGKGRYINIEDIIFNSSKQVEAYTPLPLATGIYDMHVTWPGLGITYIVPLEIIKSVIQSDIDLDNAVEAAIYDTHGNLDLTVDSDLLDYYMASEKKFIDFSDKQLGEFYLLIENEAVGILADAGLDLDIMFEDCSISIPNEALLFAKNNDKDPYIVLEGGKELEDLYVRYYAPVQGIYTDTNLNWFTLSVPQPNNLYSFADIKLVYNDDIETGRSMRPASEINGMLVCDASATGTYQFILEGMTFDDFSDDHWSAEYVYPLTALGIIDGMGDGTFQSIGLVTSAQFTKLVCTAVSLETNETLSGFADVDMDAWYYPYVCAMEAAGIIDGDYFNPNKPMRRLDMAKAVVRAYVYYTGEDVATIAAQSNDSFMDIATLSIEDRNYVKAAYVLGIINGMSETSFAPSGSATRAHASAMIFRLLEKMGIS